MQQLIEIISHDQLNVPSEEQVFKAVIHWVRHNPIERAKLLPQVIKTRFTKVTM
jgi:kelch-like protein 17 (actinfilin)